MTGPALRILSRADVLAAGGDDFHAAVDDVRAVLALMERGQATMVPEAVLPMGSDPRQNAYALPASVSGAYDAVGLKWAVHAAAPDGDRPSVTSLTIVNRLSDARPVGIVESAHLTRMRTAAVSALAIMTLLARPPRVVAVLGAGEQARTHLAMLAALFPALPRVILWSRRAEAAVRLAAEGGATPCADLDTAIEAADVILTCTSSPEPLLGESAVRPRRLIVQVGYHEVAFAAIAASDVVAVDLWGPFAETSAKSLFQMYRAGHFSPASVATDLAALAAGAYRAPADASLYFSSFGLNVFDVALAARILGTAEALGIGALQPILNGGPSP